MPVDTVGLRGPYRRSDGVNVDQVLTPRGWLGRTLGAVSRDILEEFEQQRGEPVYPSVAADVGLIVEDRASGFCGDIVAITAEAVTLRDRHSAHSAVPVQAGRIPDRRSAGHAGARATILECPQLTNSGAVAGPAQTCQGCTGPAGSGSRVVTMPSCCNTSGATSWPSWRSSSNRCTASTVWSRWSTSSVHRAQRRLGHPRRSPRRRIEGGSGSLSRWPAPMCW